MTGVDSLLSAITFIEGNLKQPIKLVDMADAAGYSLFYFCRQFSALVGCGPHDYLMARRLSEAAVRLAGTDKTITSLALDYHFGSPEGFSRAFRRLFGLLPTQARNRAVMEDFALWNPLTHAHLSYASSCSRLSIQEKILPEPICFALNPLSLTSARELFSEGKSLVWLKPRRWLREGHLLFACEASGETYSNTLYATVPAGAYYEFSHSGGIDDLTVASDVLTIRWMFNQRYTSWPYALVVDGGAILLPCRC